MALCSVDAAKTRGEMGLQGTANSDVTSGILSLSHQSRLKENNRKEREGETREQKLQIWKVPNTS